MKKINKILVPTDLTSFSLSALDYAITISDIFEAELILFYVIDKFPHISLQSIDNEQTIETEAKEKLKKILIKNYPLKNNYKIKVITGSVYDEILDYIKKEKIDVVIMATHGRPGLAHFFLGSVAEKIVRYSPVPVLTVKPDSNNEPLMENLDIEQQLHINELNNR